MCNSKDNKAMLLALTSMLTHNHDRFVSHNAGTGFMHMQYYRTAHVYARMISDYFNDPEHHDSRCDACAEAHNAWDSWHVTVNTVESAPDI